MFGTLCPEVISQSPTPLPTETAELPTPPYFLAKQEARKLTTPLEEPWDAEKWTSSRESTELPHSDHKPPPGTWSSMLRCTLFGLKCVDENAPSPSPTVEPTPGPTWSDDHWNRTSVTECHFLGFTAPMLRYPTLLSLRGNQQVVQEGMMTTCI